MPPRWKLIDWGDFFFLKRKPQRKLIFLLCTQTYPCHVTVSQMLFSNNTTCFMSSQEVFFPYLGDFFLFNCPSSSSIQRKISGLWNFLDYENDWNRIKVHFDSFTSQNCANNPNLVRSWKLQYTWGEGEKNTNSLLCVIQGYRRKPNQAIRENNSAIFKQWCSQTKTSQFMCKKGSAKSL